MRFTLLIGFIVILIFVNPQIQYSSAVIPEAYQFQDAKDDCKFFKYYPADGSLVPNQRVGHENLELVSTGYEIDRANRELLLSITMLGQPVLNNSMYYSINLELENTTTKISIRIYYGSIGISTGEPGDQALLDIYYQSLTDQNQQTDMRTIITSSDGNSITWRVSTSIIDVIRVFDDPEMLFSLVRAEFEFDINGSSSFRSGDYYRDTFQQTQFPFSGGVQSDRQGFFAIFDPWALGLYIFIPIIILIVRKYK